MSESYSCNVLIDPPAEGSWNMALDEALLEHVASGNDAVWLRFYQWREPTLSLGYFQPLSRWRDHVRQDCVVVRRQTGGGAILHDRELTYSLVFPPRHPLARGTQELYTRVHEALVAALARFAVAAQLWPNREAARGDEAFLCFLRRGSGDVVVRASAAEGPAGDAVPRKSSGASTSDFKICGSAQRRRRGALLLHGSLLLATSPVAPQIPGLEEVTGSSLSPAEARGAWLEELAPLLAKCLPRPGELPNKVRHAAERLQREKYSAAGWTARR